MKLGSWKAVQWPYNEEVVAPTHHIKVGRANVYLMDDETYHYTCSCGPNSDYSYSGCLFGRVVWDLAHAKELVTIEVVQRLERLCNG